MSNVVIKSDKQRMAGLVNILHWRNNSQRRQEADKATSREAEREEMKTKQGMEERNRERYDSTKVTPFL